MKRVLSAFLAALTLLTLTVGAEAEEGFAPALDTAVSARVTVAGGYSNFESLEAIFDDFRQIYPNAELNYAKIDDYNNAIGPLLESGDAPNIYFTYDWMRGKEEYDVCFRHAEDLSDPSLGLDLDVLRPGLLSRGEDGALPMVPVFATTYGMLVNEDLFRREGLTVPETWAELLSVCAALREKGYESPMMGYVAPSNALLYALAFPRFCADLAAHPEEIKAAAALDPEAGECMRPTLDMMTELLDAGCVDLEVCAGIADGYNALILRFFEGDVPMIVCSGDTVSGTKKREAKSEAFTAKPFAYSFYAIPTAEEGAYLVDAADVQFAVNRDCADLDMTNEFLRFLLTEGELAKMAGLKGLLPPTREYAYAGVYAHLNAIPAERTISPDALGITESIAIQLRAALYNVAKGELTTDEAIKLYGSL